MAAPLHRSSSTPRPQMPKKTRAGWIPVNKGRPHTIDATLTPAMSSSTCTIGNGPLTPKIDFHSGLRHSHIFQPPPSSASSSLQGSSVSLATPRASNRASQGRKRARHEYNAPSTPKLTTIRTPPSLVPSAQGTLPGAQLFPPLTHSEADLESYIVPGHCPGRCPERTGMTLGVDDDSDVDALAPAGGRPNSPSIRDGLGNVIFRFAGVAGKVWRNWSTSFRGFCAGEGQAYELRDPVQVDSDNNRWQVIRHDKPLLDVENLPGRFPEQDFIPDYMLQDHASTPTRAPKRARHGTGTSEKWVLVDPSADQGGDSARSASRKPPTSSASARRVARRSRRGMANAAPSRLSPNRASYASTRTPTKMVGALSRGSPVSVEVQQHAARIRRKEAEEEANLQRLNMQLKAMIREGKEALGTKFEIEEESDQENMEPQYD